MTQKMTQDRAAQIDALFDAKIEANYQQLYESWSKLNPQELIDHADDIMAAKTMRGYAGTSLATDQKEYLLKFDKPLQLLSDARAGEQSEIKLTEVSELVESFRYGVDGELVEDYYAPDSNSLAEQQAQFAEQQHALDFQIA
jgi:hypothetical protein